MQMSGDRVPDISLIDEIICRGTTVVRIVNSAVPFVEVPRIAGAAARIRVRYRGMRLVIACDTQVDSEVRVGTDEVSTIRCQGQASVLLGEAESASLRLKELTLFHSSTRTVSGSISADRLEARVRSTGSLVLNGDVRWFDVRVATTGNAMCAGLVAQKAAVAIQSTGEAELMVLDELEIAMNGVGAVRYRGEPVVVRRGAGSGSIGQL